MSKILIYIKSLIISWLITLNPAILHAQQSPGEQIYNAYISGQMNEWEKVIVELSSRKASLSDTRLTELINFYYGYTGWAVAEGHNRKASSYITEALSIINTLLEKYPGRPDLSAYKGAFLGYKIALKPLKAPFLGPESMYNINYAIENHPGNHNGWIEKGNALFYMPKMFGGSKKKALEAYNRAIELMERDPEFIHNNWIYLNVLMVLGQSYEKTENFSMAKVTYEKLLQIEPDFIYVSEELYPSFQKSMNSQE